MFERNARASVKGAKEGGGGGWGKSLFLQIKDAGN